MRECDFKPPPPFAVCDSDSAARHTSSLPEYPTHTFTLRPVHDAVSDSIDFSALTTLGGNLAKPQVLSMRARTFRSRHCFANVGDCEMKIVHRPSSSVCGREKFSDEKAYTVSSVRSGLVLALRSQHHPMASSSFLPRLPLQTVRPRLRTFLRLFRGSFAFRRQAHRIQFSLSMSGFSKLRGSALFAS